MQVDVVFQDDILCTDYRSFGEYLTAITECDDTSHPANYLELAIQLV